MQNVKVIIEALVIDKYNLINEVNELKTKIKELETKLPKPGEIFEKEIKKGK